MADALSTQPLLQFTSKLTNALKIEFLNLMHRSFAIQPGLIPSSLYFLKKLERYSLKRLQTTKFALRLSEQEKVFFYVRADTYHLILTY
jgi:hypothetical protein